MLSSPIVTSQCRDENSVRPSAQGTQRMKTRWKITPVLAVILLVTACTERSPEPETTQVTDSAGIRIAFTRINDGSAACDVSAETLRIGSVEGDEATLLFWLSDAARLSDGRIVAVNRGSAEVKVFSPEGDLLTRFGGEGEGPGEFKNLWSVDVRAGDTLVVADYRPWRFSFFTPDGEFLRSFEAQPAIIERPDVVIVLPSGDGFLIGEACCHPERGFTDRSVALRSYAPDGSLSDTLGVFWYDTFGWLSQELRYLGSPIFGPSSTLAHLRDDLMVYAPGREEQAEIWGTDGGLRSIIRWHARDREVGPGDADEWKRQYLERFPSLNDPARREIKELNVGDQRPVADQFPGNQGVLVSRDGSVWVREFRRPFDVGPRRWFLFEEDGSFLCQARVPDGLGILDVGEGYLLGRETDELDVEYLVMREVAPPAGG
jgi:hypothetical protein